MKVSIINLTAGGMSGGYKKYLMELIPRIANHESIEHIQCATPASIPIIEWFRNDKLNNVTFINCKPYSPFYHDASLISKIEAFNPDVIYVPLGRMIKQIKVPSVIMIQNMFPLIHLPGIPLYLKARCNIERIVTKRAVKRSDRIIAVSGFVKEFLIKNWNLHPDKIAVVYYGIDFSKMACSKKPKKLSQIVELRGFLFTAGSIDPYRGLEDLLEAMCLLKSKGISYPLIIAGDIKLSARRYFDKLNDIIKSLKIEDLVVWAGHLDWDEMIYCYRNCKAFVMTSRVEACPNMVLESMANGCVSISTESTPMPEFFQDSAVYYPPKDAKVLAERILEVMSWPEDKRKEMSERAKKRASQFSWEICAQKTIEQFQIAIEEFRRKKGHKRIILS